MNEFIMFIDGMMEEFRIQEQELIKLGCKDEANFVKIKINICNICKTLYNVSLKNLSAMKNETVNDEAFKEKLKEDYLRKLTRIPENWKASYEKAKEHEDAEKIVIEETKLEVLQIIRDKFEELMKNS